MGNKFICASDQKDNFPKKCNTNIDSKEFWNSKYQYTIKSNVNINKNDEKNDINTSDIKPKSLNINKNIGQQNSVNDTTFKVAINDAIINDINNKRPKSPTMSTVSDSFENDSDNERSINNDTTINENINDDNDINNDISTLRDTYRSCTHSSTRIASLKNNISVPNLTGFHMMDSYQMDNYETDNIILPHYNLGKIPETPLKLSKTKSKSYGKSNNNNKSNTRSDNGEVGSTQDEYSLPFGGRLPTGKTYQSASHTPIVKEQ
mmetsp:Transcript_59246/g.72457  ORF Transcript_59246/g.72457 Transcript_59246/m.72457 type:complete len:263 (-) Transcript_59246:70-858(-)